MSGRQQKANVKARKAKARAEHQAKLNSYRKRLAKQREADRARYRLPMVGAGLSMAAMERIIGQWDAEDRTRGTYTSIIGRHA